MSTTIRFLSFALLFPATTLLAQPPIEPKDGKLTVPFTLSPAGPRKPVSKDYLLPELKDWIPGNRVQMFLRCFMEQDALFGREESEKREKWRVMPLDQLPGDLKDYAGRLVTQDMADAARMSRSDWQIEHFIQRDGVMTLLPDLQRMRSTADVLRTRIRGATSARDFDGAIAALRTLFALGQSMNSHPTLIANLVGLAITTIGLDCLEELLQQPGCPNLFWSLADLPTPIIDVRKGGEGERVMVLRQFATLKTIAASPSDAALLETLKEIHSLISWNSSTDDPKSEFEKWIQSINLPRLARAKDAEAVKTARERLIKGGYDAKLVNGWSPLHVVVAEELLTYEELRDELLKWLNLPYWQARDGLVEAAKTAAQEKYKNTLVELVPAIQKVKQAQARIDQRIAYLEVIEAIRMYAAEHEGKLPPSLDAMKLPLPVDPVSGKPFSYSVKDGVATLTGENPNPGIPATNRVYEIRMRK